jgi:hypothetical protein
VLPAIRTAGQTYRFRRAAVEEFMAAVEAGTLDLAVGHRARYGRRRAAQDSAAAPQRDR